MVVIINAINLLFIGLLASIVAFVFVGGILLTLKTIDKIKNRKGDDEKK